MIINIYINPQCIFDFDPRGHLVVSLGLSLRNCSSHHFVQIPNFKNHQICPVLGLRNLLASRPVPPTAPWFAQSLPPTIDTKFRDGLKKVLTHTGIPQLVTVFMPSIALERPWPMMVAYLCNILCLMACGAVQQSGHICRMQ